ncbi:unnamed protein product [Cuscuta epithymum]|uniref:Uncharacterized protein n=1 Tax=Cuscuta epithymum TaxID=186058 RepID=A0AAV0ER67_9ASTE|nr:unnamed protein product [Cuscuta epithymum]
MSLSDVTTTISMLPPTPVNRRRSRHSDTTPVTRDSDHNGTATITSPLSPCRLAARPPPLALLPIPSSHPRSLYKSSHRRPPSPATTSADSLRHCQHPPPLTTTFDHHPIDHHRQQPQPMTTTANENRHHGGAIVPAMASSSTLR